MMGESATDILFLIITLTTNMEKIIKIKNAGSRFTENNFTEVEGELVLIKKVYHNKIKIRTLSETEKEKVEELKLKEEKARIFKQRYESFRCNHSELYEKYSLLKIRKKALDDDLLETDLGSHSRSLNMVFIISAMFGGMSSLPSRRRSNILSQEQYEQYTLERDKIKEEIKKIEETYHLEGEK